MTQVPWKLFWSALGAVMALALAAPAALFGVPPWVTIPGALILAGLFSVVAGRVVHGAALFRDMGQRSKDQITRLVTAAALVHVAWIAAFGLRPDLWFAWVPVLVGLVGLEYGLARAHEYQLTQLQRPTRDQQELAGQRPRKAMDQPERVLDAALERSGHTGVTVLSWESLEDKDKP